MYNLSDIITFLEKETRSCKQINENTDLERDLGITGDDVFDLLEKFSSTFQVNMEKYLWYFHHDEEANAGLGNLLFKSPRNSVDPIALTPLLLLEAANSGYWNYNYPEHKTPTKRYNTSVNLVLFVLFIILIIIIKTIKNN